LRLSPIWTINGLRKQQKKTTKDHSMKPVTILVPLYKESFSEEEAASLRQLLLVLRNHPIQFFTFPELRLDCYLQACEGRKIQVSYFDKRYFEGTWAYNKLLLSRQFYKRYQAYQYILIYQLDAWVFQDDLLDWCKKGYDYIGAPWYEGFGKWTEDAQFFGVGNGGFSLRKVESHLRILHSFAKIHSFEELRARYDADNLGSSRNFAGALVNYLFRNNTYHLLNSYNHNEDAFWGMVAPSKFPWFRVPDEMTAAQFSFEVKAPVLYESLGEKLPFGCHAWEKYHQDFWAKFIHIN